MKLSLPRKRGARPFYLVSTAGHPNYGDEVITRAWLDYLAERFPRSTVWLDCPHPGRAAHLFADSDVLHAPHSFPEWTSAGLVCRKAGNRAAVHTLRWLRSRNSYGISVL